MLKPPDLDLTFHDLNLIQPTLSLPLAAETKSPPNPKPGWRRTHRTAKQSNFRSWVYSPRNEKDTILDGGGIESQQPLALFFSLGIYC